MLEVEASYSATSIRSYGEGTSGEGRNARARRDGRQHRKHDCRFQRDGAPSCHITQTGSSKRCSAARGTLSNRRPSRYSRTATSRSLAAHVLQSCEAGNISVDWGHPCCQGHEITIERANQEKYSVTHSPIHFQIFWKYDVISVPSALCSSQLHSSFICLK